MNTLKLKIVLLCFVFFGVGYTVANFNKIKEKFCEVKQISTQTNTATSTDELQATYGSLRFGNDK